MKRLASGLLAITLLAGCGDGSTGPAFDVVLEATSVETEILIVVILGVPIDYLRCQVSMTVSAVGGKANDVAIFESGTWQAGPGSVNTGPVELAWFTDLFGSDRVRSGSSLSTTFYYDRLGASAYSFDLTFRFRMPDGALKSAWLSVPCNP